MSTPIRVLCIVSTLDRGGTENMCMNLYRNIDRNRIQFDFVKHSNSKGAFEDEVLSLGGRIFTAPRFMLYNYFQYRKWWDKFLREHPEYKIIHGHFFTTASIAFKCAHKYDVFTIGHSHASKPGNSLKSKINILLASKLEENSDACFACSRVAGEWVYKKKKFTVINNAIDTSKYTFNIAKREKLRQELNIASDEPMVCVVANIKDVKNPLGTVDIFKKIKDQLPKAKLFWVGVDCMHGALEQKAKMEGLSESVISLGLRNDVADILQAADLFMLCSFREGLPVSAIEAQASGLPCLLSNGITVETAITDLCSFLPLDQPELWSQIATRSISISRRNMQSEIINAGYDIKQTTEWLMKFYEKCIR